ncbi:MAG: molybdopterin-dependent oxidoreductase [Comamonadaceae bacterium]|nr:molybdopterin-dependent oxidoreductase [Comamonadaceae bacterium]
MPATARQDRGGDVRGGAADGEIKALWIACTNPAQSLPDQALVRERAAARPSSSWCRRPIATPRPRRFADLLLPAATWGEKEGTVTNSERRISRVRARRAAARRGARRTGQIAVDFARRLERRAGAPRRRDACSPTPTPEDDVRRTPRSHPRPRPRHHRAELRARSKTVRSSGPCPAGRGQPAAPGCTPTACSPRRDGRARFSRAGLAADRRGASTRASRCV